MAKHKNKSKNFNEPQDNIAFVPFTADAKLFKQMYMDYWRELSKYMKQKPLFTERDYKVKYEQDVQLRKFFIQDEGQYKGFIILQYVDEYSLKRPSWYVVEFYILPEFRRSWVGHNAVRHFVKTRRSDFFLYVIKANFPAHQFWDSIGRRADVVVTHRDDIDVDDDVDLYAFRFKKRHDDHKEKAR